MVDFSNLSSPSDAAVTVRVSDSGRRGTRTRRSVLPGVETRRPAHRTCLYHRLAAEQPGPLQHGSSERWGLPAMRDITLRVTSPTPETRQSPGKSDGLAGSQPCLREGFISTTGILNLAGL